jgi:hypothetical protein
VAVAGSCGDFEGLLTASAGASALDSATLDSTRAREDWAGLRGARSSERRARAGLPALAFAQGGEAAVESFVSGVALRPEDSALASRSQKPDPLAVAWGALLAEGAIPAARLASHPSDRGVAVGASKDDGRERLARQECWPLAKDFLAGWARWLVEFSCRVSRREEDCWPLDCRLDCRLGCRLGCRRWVGAASPHCSFAETGLDADADFALAHSGEAPKGADAREG